MRTGLSVGVSVAILAILVAACGTSLTAPPSGLPAALAVTPLPGGTPGPVPSPAIIAAGDSIVATFTGGYSGCSDFRADAGARGEALVITVSMRPAPGRACLAMLMSASYRAAVRGVPPGQYLVVLEEQVVSVDGKRAPPTEITRRVVRLP
jgi:hypothetical protein